MPVAQVLSQGNEIVSGQLIDTNAAWLAQQLHDRGFQVRGTASCGDDLDDIVSTLRYATRGADLLISTGGLGPTEDDLTARAVAEVGGVPLELDEDALGQVVAAFEVIGRPMNDANRKQAELPRGARVVRNPRGTAPGFAVELGGTLAIFLPGVPSEMKAMFEPSVLGIVGERWPLSPPLSATLRVAALGESVLQERVKDFRTGDPRITLGFRTYMFENHLKLVAHGDTTDPALQARFEEARGTLREILGIDCYGEGDASLAAVIGELLRGRGQTMTTAESCTGGMVSQLITAEAGSSDVFRRGFVTYHNDAKRDMLGVPEALLIEHGAVSEPVARAMAEGARRAAGADWGVALTGIAGPGGGTAEKPVGLVFAAVAGPSGTRVRRLQLFRERDLNRRLSAQAVLEMLRRDLLRSAE